MAYCRNCGTKLVDGAKFCQKCGYSVAGENLGYVQRRQEFSGKVYKCPNCGEILKSFELNCPSCGKELRGTKASSAVKEFSLKLEAIESRRSYEKPRGFFASTEAQQRVSKTDEQKISLIKNFPIPNSKEDMLEFMILATSNIDMHIYDSYNSLNLNISKGEKEINAAWFSKVQQVYEKAQRSYSTDNTFTEIKKLYDNCNEKIRQARKKGVAKWLLAVGWIPILLIGGFAFLCISGSQKEAKELERLDNIVLDVQQALDCGEYSHALRIANSIDYQLYDVEMEREWDLQREYWIEKVLEAAAENGESLTYTPSPDIDNANDVSSGNENSGSGFIDGIVDGFNQAAQPGLEDAQENVDEFNRVLNNAFKQ